MKYALAILLTALLAGCAPKSSPQGDGPRIMTDAKGQRWVVQHNFGDTFHVQKLEEN